MSPALKVPTQFRPQSPADPFDREGHTGYPACLVVAAMGHEDGLVTESERVRLSRMVSTLRKTEMRGSFLLRRRLVAHLTGAHISEVSFGAEPEGAPFLVSPPGWSVTLANKAPLTIVSVASGAVEIGVDIELIRPLDWQSMLSMICESSEREAFVHRFSDHADAPAAFFRMWTLKEAALKTTRKGFRAGPKAVNTITAWDNASGAGKIASFGHVYDYWSVTRGDAVISLVRKQS